MNSIFKGLTGLLCLVALVGTPPAAAAAEPPPLEAYGLLPAFEDAALSPSGQRIAAVVTLRGERVLLFLDAEFNVLHSTAVGNLKLRGLDWIGEEAVLLMTSETEGLGRGFTADRYEAYRAMIVPAKPTEPASVVFTGSNNIVTSIFGSYGIRQVDGEWLGHFGGVTLSRGTDLNRYLPHTRPALFAVRLSDNSPRRIANPARENEWRDWLVDADGKVAATFDMSRTTGEWRIEGPGGKRIASGRQPNGDAGLLALGHDGTTLIYTSRTPTPGPPAGTRFRSTAAAGRPKSSPARMWNGIISIARPAGCSAICAVPPMPARCSSTRSARRRRTKCTRRSREATSR
jgi:hypothetical protein